MGDNKKSVTITVNGDVYRLGVGNAVGDIAPADTLAETPHPDEEEIKEALAGNYCRCISHYQVLEAVKQAAREGSE